jgi:hypothetical protein
VAGVGTGVLDLAQGLAGEAIVAHGGHAAFDPRLVARMAWPGGVDVEAAGLGVLEEGAVDARLERIGLIDNRLGVVGDQRLEDAAEERPGRLAGLDGAGGGLRCRRPCKAA